jgi:hypothetical protein
MADHNGHASPTPSKRFSLIFHEISRSGSCQEKDLGSLVTLWSGARRFSSCASRACRGPAGGPFRALAFLRAGPGALRAGPGVPLTVVIAGHPGAWHPGAGRFAGYAPVCWCCGSAVCMIAGHRGRISPLLTLSNLMAGL